MSEDVVQGVIETIDNANQHRLKLAELLISLAEAKEQVGASFSSKNNFHEAMFNLKMYYSGPCNKRPSLLRSLGGLLWRYGVMSGCKMYKKYYLVRTKGFDIRQVGLIIGGLSSQGPLYQ